MAKKNEHFGVRLCTLGSTKRMMRLLHGYEYMHGFPTKDFFNPDSWLYSAIIQNYRKFGKSILLMLFPNIKHLKLVEFPDPAFYYRMDGWSNYFL